MPSNYLEDLVAQWYEYRGYFVRRNIQVGRRQKGGYDCELDVVALHPQKRHLVQVEASTDTFSWARREERFAKKFTAGRLHIPDLFRGLDPPKEIEQVAVLVYGSRAVRDVIGGGKIVLLADLLASIFTEISRHRLASSAVPEHLPILRGFQFVAEHRDKVWSAINHGRSD